MAKVTGIGGVFVRATDPAALARWYADALGVAFESGGSYAILRDDVPGSITVFSLFERDDPYIGDPELQSVMVNYRVDDLDAVLARLTSMVASVDDVLEEENGRFSWSSDPDGNRFELWEPTARA